jgi:hypothetical protein
VEAAAGCYRISIKDIQEKDLGVSSKQVLLPFLREGGFYSLEVICNHVPPWLEAMLINGTFTGNVVKVAENEMAVTIMKKTCAAELR